MNTPLPCLEAVVFDWAGTLVDFGSRAPMGVFVETFASFGVEITIAEARLPMGLAKRHHIAALLAMPRIEAAWTARHGRKSDETDIDRIYAYFVPRNRAVAADHAGLIPGAAQAVSTLRERGLRIGSTTGYTSDIMAEIVPVAADQGLVVETMVCAGDTKHGRPSPHMLWKALSELDVWHAWRAVKIDDTPVGIAEGTNAGSWAIGVAVSGNLMGCSEAELAELPATEFARRRADASQALLAAGAHLVIDSVAELMPALAAIEGLLARGERP